MKSFSFSTKSLLVVVCIRRDGCTLTPASHRPLLRGKCTDMRYHLMVNTPPASSLYRQFGVHIPAGAQSYRWLDVVTRLAGHTHFK